MRRALQSALLLALSALAAAVFKDEVGHTDFHHALVGVPQREATFFHRPRKEEKASLLYTLSDVGVVGAINPANGAIVWRQQVGTDGGYLRAPEGESWVASASGHKVHAWDALTGRNMWQAEFAGEVKDLEVMEMTENTRKDVLALFQEDGAMVLRRLHGGLGTVVWEFREVGKDVPLQVSTNVAHIFVVSLHGSSSSYAIRTTSLDTATGTRVEQWSSTKGDVSGPQDVMFVGANSAAPLVAWKNPTMSKLSIHVLGTKSRHDIGLPADVKSVDVHAPNHLAAQPHFLVHIRTANANRAEVYHTNLKNGQITSAYELPHVGGVGAISTSSDGANVYFTRIMGDEMVLLSSESHGVLARWRIKLEDGAEAVQAVSDVLKKPGNEGFAVRSAALTTAEDWIMIRNGEMDWSRPEGMSGAVAAVLADIPEPEGLAKALEQEAHTNPLSAYVHRVLRHLDDLQYLPSYLLSLPKKIFDNFIGSDASSKGGLEHDSFGFNKIVVLVTRRGRFYGLNTGDHGQVIWTKSILPQSAGEALDVKGMAVKEADGVVVVQGVKGELVVLKPQSGEVVDLVAAGSAGSVVASTAVVETSEGKQLLSFTSDGKLATPYTGPALEQTFVVKTEGNLLKGIKLAANGDKIVEQEEWQLSVLPGQRIIEIASLPAHNPVASIGRVLGDRRVNYKYLNSNTMVVGIYDDAVQSLSVRLIDIVSGAILSSQAYEGIDATKDISCTMAENWYACSFFGDYVLNDGTDRAIKGYQLAVSDLYESPAPNDRGPLGEAANYSSLEPVETPSGVPLPWVVSQTWIVSQPLTHLSVTSTRQGISVKNLLAYLPETSSVMSLLRGVVDPRRPVGRDPTPAEIESEGLMRYMPGIEIDPRTLISHEREVFGVRDIVATPAVVESTSLVLAFGIDVFGTRVAPSGVFDILGKGFDKVTMVGTVLALFVGVMFLSPMVRRKQINKRWEAPM